MRQKVSEKSQSQRGSGEWGSESTQRRFSAFGISLSIGSYIDRASISFSQRMGEWAVACWREIVGQQGIGMER